MENEERVSNKAEELLMALGAKPEKLATENNQPALRDASTKETGDMTGLYPPAPATGNESDDWLNSTPPVPTRPRAKDTDSLDVYTALSSLKQEPVEDTLAKATDFPDNPFEVSEEMPDLSVPDKLPNIQQHHTGIVDIANPPSDPGVKSPASQQRHTDVIDVSRLPSDPGLRTPAMRPQPMITTRSESAPDNTLYRQKTIANAPLPANMTQPDTQAQAPNMVQIPPVWPRGESTQHDSGKGRIIALLVCLLLFGVMSTVWLMNLPQALSQQTPSQTPGVSTPAAPTSAVTPPAGTQSTPTAPPSGVYKYSFEDGGTDSWASNQNISLVQNSTTIAKDGSHSLKVTFNSSSAIDYPAVSASKLPSSLRAGQTVTAYVYVASGSAVRAKIFIQDQNMVWFDPGRTALDILPVGSWHQLRFTLPPAAAGSARIVGIQFYGYNTTAYIDIVNW